MSYIDTWRSRSYSPVASAALKSVSSLWEVSHLFMLTRRFPCETRIAVTKACNRRGNKKQTKNVLEPNPCHDGVWPYQAHLKNNANVYNSFQKLLDYSCSIAGENHALGTTPGSNSRTSPPFCPMLFPSSSTNFTVVFTYVSQGTG